MFLCFFFFFQVCFWVCVENLQFCILLPHRLLFDFLTKRRCLLFEQSIEMSMFLARRLVTRCFSSRPLHVCIVGSGPAGFYTADKVLHSSLFYLINVKVPDSVI